MAGQIRIDRIMQGSQGHCWASQQWHPVEESVESVESCKHTLVAGQIRIDRIMQGSQGHCWASQQWHPLASWTSQFKVPIGSDHSWFQDCWTSQEWDSFGSRNLSQSQSKFRDTLVQASHGHRVCRKVLPGQPVNTAAIEGRIYFVRSRRFGYGQVRRNLVGILYCGIWAGLIPRLQEP